MNVSLKDSLGVLPRSNAKDMWHMGMYPPVLMDVWIYFHLIANTILLPILVTTFFMSKKVRRHSTLVNLCITWIFSGIFSLLLFFAGKHRGDEPGSTLCIIQTSLLYGITPMWAVAILMLLYYMLVALHDDISSLGRGITIFMLSAPYIAQCSFTIATLILAWNNTELVNRHRRFFYCSLNNNGLAMGMWLFTLTIGLGILVLGVALGSTLYRNWRALRKVGQKSGVEVQLFVRVLIFVAYIAFGMFAITISIFDPHNLMPDLYAATIGAAVFLLFGTQPDVLRVWCFWRRSTPVMPCCFCSWKKKQMMGQFDEEKGYDRNIVQRPATVLIIEHR
ncbi:hypothetical protein BDZ94DRAFT_1322140 [Collybia nuda]|uniref:Uncharacterized protein n=1 Tax=Collybia nuda TaxID=64659 RepID=A0A9P6CJP4_9AGAR|nr:hypothetical protein BDZ94DRAFT_1322140 [Collybia nuda]